MKLSRSRRTSRGRSPRIRSIHRVLARGHPGDVVELALISRQVGVEKLVGIGAGTLEMFEEVENQGRVVDRLMSADGIFPHTVFRATKILPDHPGLGGRRLRPLDPQPPIAVATEAGSDIYNINTE